MTAQIIEFPNVTVQQRFKTAKDEGKPIDVHIPSHVKEKKEFDAAVNNTDMLFDLIIKYLEDRNILINPRVYNDFAFLYEVLLSLFARDREVKLPMQIVADKMPPNPKTRHIITVNDMLKEIAIANNKNSDSKYNSPPDKLG